MKQSCEFVVVVFHLLSWHLYVAKFHLNDTIPKWIELTDHQLDLWYTSENVCLIRESRTVQADPRRVKVDTCKSSSNALSDPNGNYSVGFGYDGKICIPPLFNRKHLRSGLQELSDPKSKYLHDAFHILAESNYTLVLLGDSLTGQNFDAIYGEIYRVRNEHVRIISESDKSYNNSILPVHDTILKHGGRIGVLSVYGKLLYIYFMRINYVGSPESSTFYNRNQSSFNLEKLKGAVHDVIESFSGVMMVANIGLWYNNRTVHFQEMPSLLVWLNELPNRYEPRRQIIVSWRETSCSHFDRLPSGYYKYKDGGHKRCVPLPTSQTSKHTTFYNTLDHSSLNPLNNSNIDIVPRFDPAIDAHLDWRNIDVYHILSSLGLHRIHVIKFYDITKPLHDLHLIMHRVDSRRYGYAAQTDCNHFCWTPLLWQPIWYAVYQLSTLVNSKDPKVKAGGG